MPLVQGLNWNAHHLDNHIEEAMRLTRVVSETLAAIKGNVDHIEEALRRLLKAPMFERKEGKVRKHDVSNSAGAEASISSLLCVTFITQHESFCEVRTTSLHIN